MNFLELFLGILTSMGGFVEIGELVFASQAGALFSYSLLWVLALGTIGIIIYCEMGGRIAMARKMASFEIIREQLGNKLGLVNLISANFVNLITCTAEIGGMALILKLVTGWPYAALVIISLLIVFFTLWFLPFKYLERSLGMLGLFMITFMLTSLSLHPHWGEVAKGLIPTFPRNMSQFLLFAYFAVGIVSSTMMPYEMYFYTSGAIEDKWTKKDKILNRITTLLGLPLGSLLAASIIINAAVLFAGRGIDPHLIGTSLLQNAFPYGLKGLYFACAGAFFAILGAAVETVLSGAYSICQYFHIPWGREKKKKEVQVFTELWIGMIVVSGLILASGISPIDLVEYSVILSVVILPLSYYAVLKAGSDKKEMGELANGKLSKSLGWIFLVIVTLVSISAIPLMILTRGGSV